MQLAMADVYGVNAFCPVLEEDLRKSAGGCADVETDPSFRVKVKMLEGSCEFDAASRNVGMRGARAYDGIGCQFFGSLTHRLIVGKYKPRFDRRLGFGAAFK